MIDWGSIVSQAPSIALALVFAWFAVTLINGQREHSAKIMGEWSDRMKQRDADWQRFIEDQRRQGYEASTRIADELNRVGVRMAEHDQRAEDRHTRLLDAVVANGTQNGASRRKAST